MSIALMSANKKFLVLVRTLKIPAPYVRGLLDTLWDTCHANSDPYVGTAEEIEAAAGWPGVDGEFAAALILRSWVDLVPGSVDTYVVHDYWDHAPYYVQERQKKRLAREKRKKMSRTCLGQEGDASGTSSGQEGDNLTLALALAPLNEITISQSLDHPSSPPPSANLEKPESQSEDEEKTPLRAFLDENFAALSDHQRDLICGWGLVTLEDAEEKLELWHKVAAVTKPPPKAGAYAWAMFDSIRFAKTKAKRDAADSGVMAPLRSFAAGVRV